MSNRVTIVALTLLMIACGSGGVFSQMTVDSVKEIRLALFKELHKSEAEMRQFEELIQPLHEALRTNVQQKIIERMQDASMPVTPEDGMKLGLGFLMDGYIEMQKPFNEKATEFFSEEGRQKIQLWFFQVKMGLMDRLGAIDDPVAIQMASGFNMAHLMGGQPDFLELSSEQRELITKQQKETSIEAMSLAMQAGMKMMTENPEKAAEMMRLEEERQNAETDEERDEIDDKLMAFGTEVLKDIAPELKRIALKGHEDFMRVLTDEQKAKIKAVMADMPDYIKNLLAEMDKGNDVSSVLNSWIPGMGVPGINPNREAPRERPQRERTFPGN